MATLRRSVAERIVAESVYLSQERQGASCPRGFDGFPSQLSENRRKLFDADAWQPGHESHGTCHLSADFHGILISEASLFE